jgi:hypothetical protein
MKNAVDEADAGGFVGVLVWELDVDFPEAALEGCWGSLTFVVRKGNFEGGLTFFGPLESNVEFLPVVQIQL